MRDDDIESELQMKKRVSHQANFLISLSYKRSFFALLLQSASVRDLDYRKRVRDLLRHDVLQRSLVRDEFVLLVFEMTIRTKVATIDVNCQLSIRLRVDLLFKR